MSRYCYNSYSATMIGGPAVCFSTTRGSTRCCSECAFGLADSDDSPHGNPEEQHFSEAPEDGSPGSFRSRSLEATAALSSSIAQSMLFQSSQGSFGA